MSRTVLWSMAGVVPAIHQQAMTQVMQGVRETLAQKRRRLGNRSRAERVWRRERLGRSAGLTRQFHTFISKTLSCDVNSLLYDYP